MSEGGDSVQQWLASIGCAELAEVFAANAITAALLPTLTEEDLRELGIEDAPRATLLAAIAALNSPPPTPLAPAPTRAAAPSPKPPPAPRPASPKPAAKRQPAPPPPPAPRPAPPTTPAPVRGADEPIPVVVAPPASRGIPVWAFVTTVGLLLVIIGLLVGGFFPGKRSPRPAVAAAPAKAAHAAQAATPGGPMPIILAAKTAKLAGSLAFDPAKNTVGGWSRPGDYLEWRAPIRTAGKYAVQLEYSSQPASGAVICEIGGQKVRANLASTGDWNKFTRATLGSMQVAKAGDQPLKLRSGSPTKGGLVNVRTLTLTPAK